MATKINQSYYGTSDNWSNIGSSDVQRGGTPFGTLITNNNWNILNNDNIDTTIVPWGVGESSVSALGFYVFGCEGRTGTNYGGNLKYENNTSGFRNMPIMFCNTNGVTELNYSNSSATRTAMKQRVVGNTYKQSGDNSTTLRSNATVDNTTTLSISRLSAYPLVKAEYRKIRTLAENVQLLYVSEGGNTWSAKSVTAKNLKTYISTDPDEKYFVTNFSARLYANSTSSEIYGFSGTKSKIPKFMREMYFNNDVEEWIDLKRNVGTWFGTSRQYWSIGSKSFMPFESYGTKSADFPISTGGNNYTHCHTKKQVFDDVSYHWEPWVYQYMGGIYNELSEGRRLPATSGSSFTVYIGMRLIIDSHTYDDIYKAYHAAILHECAFIGFEVIDDTNNFSNTTGGTGIYTPLFDYEHMITTGDFKTGEDAEALPNATWGDIFDDGMPTYDPSYIPPEPEPIIEDSDYGDTSNLGSARGLFPAGVNIYLMSRSDYNIFMGELNGYYQGSSPDDWTLDFQGVNPSDYILSAYYTPYNFLKSDTKSAVKIGPLTLTTTAYELSQGSPPDDPNKWKTFTYGTRTVTPAFYDFRDYEPFTTVELYLPLAGTVQLETAYVMNHDITVTYYFDLMSMSGVACVYRDNMLYKTSDFQLGCQVPLLSQNMGTIQNQIMSLDTARKQNNIRLTAATTATTGSAIKALSGKASDVSNIAGGAGLLQIASGVINADKIDYDLTHTPASVSVTGAAEPMNNYSVGQLTPKLIIKRPLMLPDKNDEIYAHTVGNACLINTTVGEMSGLIVCSNTDLSGIAATSTELSAIQSALTTGIYV